MSPQPNNQCVHCGKPVLSPGDSFCCGGCELAYQIVTDAGLESYYEHRDQPAPKPQPSKVLWSALEAKPVELGLQFELVIDDLRCTSCTWVVEHVLERQEGVKHVQVSYATGLATIVIGDDVDIGPVVQAIENIGYRPRPIHTASDSSDLLIRLGVSSFATANLMLMAVSLYSGWFTGMEERFATLFRWGSLMLATPVALYSAAPFFTGAMRSLSARSVGMDVPIAIAVGVLYTHGVVQTLLGAEGYLDSLAMLVTLLLAGRLLERRGRQAAAQSASMIAAQLPQTAQKRTDTGVTTVPLEELVVGDLIEVTGGEDFPADGVVVWGRAHVQMALLTGEPKPVAVEEGASVVAGASLVNGAVTVKVTAVGEASRAMQIAEVIRTATAHPLPDNPVEKLAPAFTAATLGAAFLAGGLWFVFVDLHSAMEIFVATLVVACPCALGLSVPLAASSGLSAVARRGVLFSDAHGLLRLNEVTHLAFDKTGTITRGRLSVFGGSDEALSLAAAVERHSRHPVARAVAEEAERRGVKVVLAESVKEELGRGIGGRVNGSQVWVGAAEGGVEVVVDGERLALLVLGESPRADALEAMTMLKAAGLTLTLLSGDEQRAADKIAQSLPLSEVRGGLSPEDKSRWISEHQPVAFVGDGLNDGPALATAHVGLAMVEGVPASLLASDGIVTQRALRPVVAAVAGARATKAAIDANLRRSIVYNGVSVVAAMLGLINPLVAAILMPLSSAVVIIGAMSVPKRLEKLEAEWTS